MSERDFAKAILAEITSAAAIDAALETWGAVAELPDRDLLALVIADVAAFAIGNALARRSAHTDDVERARREERELCARRIEALACQLRDNGPVSAAGLLSSLAGAQVGCLLDAAASLRLARTGPGDAP